MCLKQTKAVVEQLWMSFYFSAYANLKNVMLMPADKRIQKNHSSEPENLSATKKLCSKYFYFYEIQENFIWEKKPFKLK